MFREKDNDFGGFDTDEFEPLYGRKDKVKDHLEDRLKKTVFGGYTRSSVEQYAVDISEQSEQMKDNLEKQIRDLSSECSKLSSECSVLRKQIHEAEEEKKNVVQKMDSVTVEKQELERQLQSEYLSGKEQKNRISTLKEEIQEKEAKLEKYRGMIRQLQEQLQDAVQKEDERNREISHLQEQLQEADSKAKELNQEILRLQKNNNRETDAEEQDKLRKNADELERLQRMCQDISEKNEQLNRLLANSDNIQEKLTKAEEKVEELTRQNGILTQKLTEKEQTYKEFSQEMATKMEETKSGVAETEKKYAKLYEQYMASLGKTEQLVAEKNAVERLLKKYQIREQELSILREDNAELRETATQLKKALDIMLDEMEEQAVSYRLIAEQLAEKKEEISSLNEQKVELQMKNVQILERMESLARTQTSSSEKKLLAGADVKDEKVESETEHEIFNLRTKDNKEISKTSTQDILERARNITKEYSA